MIHSSCRKGTYIRQTLKGDKYKSQRNKPERITKDFKTTYKSYNQETTDTLIVYRRWLDTLPKIKQISHTDLSLRTKNFIRY